MTGHRLTIPMGERARWAVRHTTWTSIWRDILPSVAAAVATYVVTLLTAPKGTPVDRRAVGYPLAAGVIALIAVYVVVNLVEFAVNVKRAGPRLRVEAEQRRQDALVQGSRDTIIKDWLRQYLAQPSFHVQFAAAFGSVTRSYATRDVDAVVQLMPASDHEVRMVGLRVKQVSRTFRDEFGIPLHLQLFTSDETSALLGFATRAGSLDVLIGASHWDAISAQSTSTSSEAE
jgi:hypothetical protein